MSRTNAWYRSEENPPLTFTLANVLDEDWSLQSLKYILRMMFCWTNNKMKFWMFVKWNWLLEATSGIYHIWQGHQCSNWHLESSNFLTILIWLWQLKASITFFLLVSWTWPAVLESADDLQGREITWKSANYNWLYIGWSPGGPVVAELSCFQSVVVTEGPGAGPS